MLELYNFVPSVCQSVSMLSILLVAVYQFITIRVDPFGSRHLITTPRCIGACVLSWAVPFVVFFAIREQGKDGEYMKILIPFEVLGTLPALLIGIVYVLIYKSVANSSSNNPAMKERQRENKRLLCTYAIICGTTLVVVVLFCIIAMPSVQSLLDLGCVQMASTSLLELNLLCNVLVYWLRLKEFRSLIKKCLRKNRVEALNIVTSIQAIDG